MSRIRQIIKNVFFLNEDKRHAHALQDYDMKIEIINNGYIGKCVSKLDIPRFRIYSSTNVGK